MQDIKQAKKVISITISEEADKQLIKLARDDNRSKSATVEQLVRLAHVLGYPKKD